MTNSEIRNQMISAREEFIDIIKAELMGPGSEFNIPDKEHELISSSPISRYSVGILYPREIKMQNNDEVLDTEDNVVDNENLEDSIIDKKEDNIEESNKPDYIADNIEDENLDEEINMSTQFKPSSMGITFLAKGKTDKVICDISFAIYRKAEFEECCIPFTPENTEEYAIPFELTSYLSYNKEDSTLKLKSKLERKDIRRIFEKDNLSFSNSEEYKKIMYGLVDMIKPDRSFVRIPIHIKEWCLDFSQSDNITLEETEYLENTTAKIVGFRKKLSDDIWSITLMLVNDSSSSAKTVVKDHLFQSKVIISTENNFFTILNTNIKDDIDSLDEEEQSLALLYRNKKIYGTGLGTSVDWIIDDDGNGKLWTDFFPVKEIPGMSFSLNTSLLSDKELSMKYLSDLNSISKEQKLLSLYKLVDLYKKWIESIEEDSQKISKSFYSIAIKNIEQCKTAYNRMFEGIKTLEQNENAYNAFLLANRAMFMQRVHIRLQNSMNSDYYPGEDRITEFFDNLDYYKETDDNCVWRPFQIAFILMDIISIVDDKSNERNIVDLIWFPTGGGKTEAYLGLTAFAIFYRRLMHIKESDGTSVIMRYTLRLLAAQQFTRASTLICACEMIRINSERKYKYPVYKLGNKKITIGLWIGSSHIPNTNEEADKCLEKLLNITNSLGLKHTKEKYNKFQVLKCPWCGTKMVKDAIEKKIVGKWGYNMRKKHFYMFCPHEDCDFTNELPIQIIDEELYNNPPSLLFGTVDKFAMIPWDGRIGSFFGVGNKNRSVDLIIQDELHLISGALGSIVGIYETAIDAICSSKGVTPKIVASTATIRRAKSQCSSLYNREVSQFPPPGINSEDSFFSREEIIDHQKGVYGRKYVAIMPSGKTKSMMEIRSMAAILQKVHTTNWPDEIKDKFWTLTSYFNSLKDLGKAYTLVEDDVKDFIIRTANRMYSTRRIIVNPDELTSRVSTTELNETLDKLEKTEYSITNIENKKYPSNILLATNMISVGIDIARLNVMLVVGQPKLTSEYIQASSRVGRSFPGIVFIQYDATKSRDRSHYEQFYAYHDSYYRFVEPTGVTPFSKPARERAIHSVLISIIRQKMSLIDDKSAEQFDYNDSVQKRIVNDTMDNILTRIEQVYLRDKLNYTEELEEIKCELKEIVYDWQEKAEIIRCDKTDKMSLNFGRKYMVNNPSELELRLLRQFNKECNDNNTKQTLTSMRNVDAPVGGSILIWEE